MLLVKIIALSKLAAIDFTFEKFGIKVGINLILVSLKPNCPL